jgi:hypothetical protein
VAYDIFEFRQPKSLVERRELAAEMIGARQAAPGIFLKKAWQLARLPARQEGSSCVFDLRKFVTERENQY